MEEKLQAVLKYAGNDLERAKKIMQGDLKDVRLIKGYFTVSSVELYSRFLLFFDTENEILLNITLVLYSDPALHEKIDLEESWKLFFTKVRHTMEAESVRDSRDIIAHLAESIEGYQMIYDVQDNEAEAVEITLSDIAQKIFGVEDVECKVSLDDISTLDMVENNIPIGKLPKQDNEVKTASEDEGVSEIEKQAQFTVESSLLISPVSGKNIREVVPGDLLKVVMKSKNEVTNKIATALNALDEDGNFLPVKGRVKEITPLPEGGYRIYCLIAKGILAKIIEEEDIKAEMFIPEEGKTKKDKLSKNQMKLLVYGILFTVVLIVAIILIMMLI